MLHGRTREQANLDTLVHRARTGRSGVLVVRGEAGIGKTALLDHLAEQSEDMRILRGTAVESESELAFAGLHLLLGAFTDRLEALPHRQREAMRAAFGMTDTPATDRFLTGLATLSLLGELAGEGPLLVLLDDAHWLDQASAEALLFAARRLEADSVALVFAARDGSAFSAPGLPELRLSGLGRTAAADLLAEQAADLAGHVRDRILDEAQGNPLALLELAAALTPAQRAGDLPAGPFSFGAQPVSQRIEQTFLRRVDALPDSARLLLVVIAADTTGDLGVVLAAGKSLGGSVHDLAAAEDSRLVRVADGRLSFAHPLIRSTVYRAAPATRRMAAHRALAGVTEADERAWHLAAATAGPDESAAAELERTAEHSRNRGGYAAESAAYQRAAQLTPDRELQGRRLAAAARAAASAGRPQLALSLADQAVATTSDPLVLAGLARIRAAGAGERDHPAEVLAAAMGVSEQSSDTAAFLALDLMTEAWSAGDGDAMAALAARMDTGREQRRPLDSRRVVERRPALFDKTAAVAARLTPADLPTGVPLLRELLDDFGESAELGLWERTSVQWWTHWLGDVESAHITAAQLVRDCRELGAAGPLPRGLTHLARAQLLLGRPREALVTASEGLRIAQDTGQAHDVMHHAGLLACVAAIEGDEDRCRKLTAEFEAHDFQEGAIDSLIALNLLDLGLGRYDAILRRMRKVAADPVHFLLRSRPYSLPDFLEAAVLAGEPEEAERASAVFSRWAEATGQPWALAVAERGRALLADGDEAGRHYARAVELHRDDHRPLERARTELLYGEWLRRRLQRNKARDYLRSALETFDGVRAAPWAHRARGELRAVGDTPGTPDRGPGLLDLLTPQELQVVRLAATGMSNREIAAQMFLSPRTVGYHLYKAYPKLGIASRGDLVRMNL